MKINFIFPGLGYEANKFYVPCMPVASTLLAALTPPEHEVTITDMLFGDPVNYDSDCDLVAITVRTPLAPLAYTIADQFKAAGKQVILGGPHIFALPGEAKKHADAVTIGEAEELWPIILDHLRSGQLKDYYVCGPYNIKSLDGSVHHLPQRPTLANLPMMRRDLLPRKRYIMDSIFTTRGCPNNCNFCPVTPIFGPHIRHRPIDEVVAEVDTLRRFYFNVDDSAFGHPQITDKPEENQYYLDLYKELAGLKKKRTWSGAGGISAVNYKDGHKIIKLAAQSGLSLIAAGLESISPQGQKQSGAWRKLHFPSPDAFDINTMEKNIRTIQDLGIEIMGFFIIGWDNDTRDTYMRTLEFCHRMKIIPVILTLAPMPGTRLYHDYREQGKLIPGIPWDHYDSSEAVFKHPTMSPGEMAEQNARAMHKGFGMGRIISRTFFTLRKSASLYTAFNSFFNQLGMRKTFHCDHKCK